MSKLTILLVTALGLAALFCTLLIESNSTGLKRNQIAAYNNAWVKIKNVKTGLCICTEKPFGSDLVGDDQFSYACGCNEPDVVLFYFENTKQVATVMGGTAKYTKFYIKAADLDKKANYALQILPKNTINGVQFRKIKGAGDDGQKWYVVTDYVTNTVHLRNVWKNDQIIGLAGSLAAPNLVSHQPKSNANIPETARWTFVAA